MQDVAKDREFETRILLTSDATARNVVSEIRSAASALRGPDMFFLTYSGHGGQVPDLNSEEDDRLDETWVLHDTQLLDDELYGLLSTFAEGVQIFVMSDSCHSGTVTKVAFDARDEITAAEPGAKRAPVEYTKAEFDLHRDEYETRALFGLQLVAPQPHVRVLLLSGCQDWQTSLDGANHGAFTQAFLNIWNNGRFTGSYRDLCQTMRGWLPLSQQPNLFGYGPGVEDMKSRRPLTG